MKKMILLILSVVVLSSGAYASDIMREKGSYKISGLAVSYTYNAIYLDNFSLKKIVIRDNKKVKPSDLSKFIKISKNGISFEKFLKIKAIKNIKIKKITSHNAKIKILNKLNIKNIKGLYNMLENNKFKYIFTSTDEFIGKGVSYDEQHHKRYIIIPNKDFNIFYIIGEPIAVGFEKIKKYNSKNKEIIELKGKKYESGYRCSNCSKKILPLDNYYGYGFDKISIICSSIGARIPSKKDFEKYIKNSEILFEIENKNYYTSNIAYIKTLLYPYTQRQITYISLPEFYFYKTTSFAEQESILCIKDKKE